MKTKKVKKTKSKTNRAFARIQNAVFETWFTDGTTLRHFALVQSRGKPAKILVDGVSIYKPNLLVEHAN